MTCVIKKKLKNEIYKDKKLKNFKKLYANYIASTNVVKNILK